MYGRAGHRPPSQTMAPGGRRSFLPMPIAAQEPPENRNSGEIMYVLNTAKRLDEAVRVRALRPSATQSPHAKQWRRADGSSPFPERARVPAPASNLFAKTKLAGNDTRIISTVKSSRRVANLLVVAIHLGRMKLLIIPAAYIAFSVG